MKTPIKPIERIVGAQGDKPKCVVFPSGNVSFHIWKTKAKVGDKCLCGASTLRKAR